MHIAASKPICVSSEQVSPELLARERQIYAHRRRKAASLPISSTKWLKDVLSSISRKLLFSASHSSKIRIRLWRNCLPSKSAKVNGFTLFIVGEGIEKKTGDFAAEVMAQVNQAKEDKATAK